MSATTISAAQVKELRDLTGAGIMECKRALTETGGDVKKAEAIIVQQGLAKADKKSGRSASEGVIEPYVHGGRIGALVEINCENDFVARTDDFKTLAHDVAMQVAAMSPRYVSEDEISESDWSRLEEEFGDRKAAVAATVLLEQPFIKDSKVKIGDLVRTAISKLGENIVIRRFARFEVGADLPAAVDAE
jgi:elongation factor Ts